MFRLLLVAWAVLAFTLPSTAFACSEGFGPAPTDIRRLSEGDLVGLNLTQHEPGTFYVMTANCGSRVVEAKPVMLLYNMATALQFVAMFGSPLLFVLLLMLRRKRPELWDRLALDPMLLAISCLALSLILQRLERPGPNFCPPDFLNPAGIGLLFLTIVVTLAIRLGMQRRKRPAWGAVIATLAVVAGTFLVAGAGFDQPTCGRTESPTQITF